MKICAALHGDENEKETEFGPMKTGHTVENSHCETCEKYREMLAKLLDDKITWSVYSKTCDEVRAALGEEK